MRAAFRLIAVASTTALVLSAGLADASRGSPGPSEIGSVDLQATGVDADARGRARFRIVGGDDGRFEVQVSRLERDATYEVVVDGVRVASIVTSGGGNGRARFRSRPR